MSFQHPLDIGKMEYPLGHGFKLCFITVLWKMNKYNHYFLCFSWNVAQESRIKVKMDLRLIRKSELLQVFDLSHQ